jgi:hypothetical protein
VNPRRATAKPFAAVVAVLIALVASACSSGSPGSTATPDGETSAAGGDEARWLFTLTAESATFGDGELRLTGIKLGQSVAARAEPYYTFSVDGSSFNCSIGRPLISTYYYDYVDVCTPGGGPSAVVGVRFRASS